LSVPFGNKKREVFFFFGSINSNNANRKKKRERKKELEKEQKQRAEKAGKRKGKNECTPSLWFPSFFVLGFWFSFLLRFDPFSFGCHCEDSSAASELSIVAEKLPTTVSRFFFLWCILRALSFPPFGRSSLLPPSSSTSYNSRRRNQKKRKPLQPVVLFFFFSFGGL
jgi:hypothetical protein